MYWAILGLIIFSALSIALDAWGWLWVANQRLALLLPVFLLSAGLIYFGGSLMWKQYKQKRKS